jgi:uncharacterized membrane protein
MNENALETGKTAGEPKMERSSSRRGFVSGMVTGGLLGVLLAGGIAGYAKAVAGPGFFPRPGHGSFCGRGVHDPQAVRERVDFATDWVLSRINASEEQRQRIKGIVRDAMAELQPLGARHRENREAMIQVLLQPTVDRAALETIRHSEMELAEAASARLVEAVASTAELLTVEQRQELANLAHKLHR